MTDNNKQKTPVQLFPKLAKIASQWTQCADCNDTHPKWAEIDRGILICLNCSGVHRSLGTHVSKVRSLTLDIWTDDMVNNMVESDKIFNKLYEYHVPVEYMKPTLNTRRDIRTKYIKAKYIGIKDYKITKKLIPAFHKDQYGALGPIYATAEYDDVDDQKSNNNHCVDDKHKGLVEYTGVITIHCISANDLPKADLFSDSDPYVIFSNHSGQSVKTKVIQDNNNPTWDQDNLTLSVNELKPISIEIFDEDDMTKDDLLCTSSLHIGNECQNGKKCKFNMQMDVDRHYKKQKKHSTLTFTVTYTKLDAH